MGAGKSLHIPAAEIGHSTVYSFENLAFKACKVSMHKNKSRPIIKNLTAIHENISSKHHLGPFPPSCLRQQAKLSQNMGGLFTLNVCAILTAFMYSADTVCFESNQFPNVFSLNISIQLSEMLNRKSENIYHINFGRSLK